MTGEETDEQEELEAQLGTAMQGLQRAVVRLLQEGEVHPHLVVLALARVTGEVGAGAALLQEGEVHPHLVVLALARVTGEVGAGAALAGGHDPERVLGELAEVVREAGREFREMLETGALPTAGNA